MQEAQDLAGLRERFSIPGVVAIEPGEGGLTRLTITPRSAEAHLYLHGAHVTHYQPRDCSAVLFMSGKSLFAPGRPIRGGVPVIFPWFGPRADDSAAPAHGFARTMLWTLSHVSHEADGTVRVSLSLASAGATRGLWPHEFQLTYTIIVGPKLELALAVRNTSGAAFTFEEALHTYLAVGDVRRATVEGLAGREYLDKTDGMKRTVQGAGPFPIENETDRVYLRTPDTVVVHDPHGPSGPRMISVAKQNSDATVVWNPWIAKARAMADFGDDEWPAMLCVETANAADHAVTLPAGDTHVMQAAIQLFQARAAGSDF